jgi:hypothetical protein
MEREISTFKDILSLVRLCRVLRRLRPATVNAGMVGDFEEGDPVLESYLRRRHGRVGREQVLGHFRPEMIWESLSEEYGRLLQSRAVGEQSPRRLHGFRAPTLKLFKKPPKLLSLRASPQEP